MTDSPLDAELDYLFETAIYRLDSTLARTVRTEEWLSAVVHEPGGDSQPPDWIIEELGDVRTEIDAIRATTTRLAASRLVSARADLLLLRVGLRCRDITLDKALKLLRRAGEHLRKARAAYPEYRLPAIHHRLAGAEAKVRRLFGRTNDQPEITVG
ncbi:hypothetical protein ACFWY9_39805 [Amycolatopsis sp. NPDC059027]|uniref:hypothetical protein n=1 Tax=Amycolatopsis sp. NPDC059027 TaxID=3346709 RepID=UPI00366CDB3B